MADETQDVKRSDPSLDELLARCIAAEEAGRPLDRQELLARHPQLAAELREFFANRDQMQRLAAPLRGEQPSSLSQGGGPKRVRYFGDYELLDEIAAGGMGIVYKARQVSLNRIVAVKMILKGTLASEEDVKRFRAEAEAAASLQHPAIVAIHEVGLHEGQHYFSMDYVDGQSLAEVPRQQPLSGRQAAEYVRDAAEAVHYAHQQGTLHRDLKPSNILIDRHGRVRITDFGLAKRIEGNSDLTLTGQILGTPSYMPPEQASGKRSLIGAASDIYALGAVLYDVLTGRPPFRGESPAETLRQVETLDPVSARLLNPAVPRDLETICLKCLEKEPHKRYGTAQLLADDLGRYLRGEPIVARPISSIARSWRWCRRNSLLATTGAMAVGLLLMVAAVASVAYVREASLRQDLEYEQRATKRALEGSQIAVSDMRTYSGLSAGEQGDSAAAALWFSSTTELLDAGNDRARLNRLRAAIWGSLAPRPLSAVMHPEEWVMGVRFHPSGQYIMTWSPRCGSFPGACAIWDLIEERQVSIPGVADTISCGAWSRDGRILALGTDRGKLLLQQFPDGQEPRVIEFDNRIDFLEVDPTDHFLAIVYGQRDAAARDERQLKSGTKVRVWDLQEETFATPELTQPASVSTLLFHPQGRQLVIGNHNGTCLAYGIPSESSRPLSRPLVMYQYGPSVAVGERPARPFYIDEGKTLCTIATIGGSIRRWDTTSWSAISPGPQPIAPLGDVKATAVTSDGKLIIVGSRRGMTVLSAATLEVAQFRPIKPRQYMFDVAVSPDGRFVLSGGGDRTAQLWALPSAQPEGPAIEHSSSVLAVDWSSDGQRFVTAQRGGLVRVWSVPGTALPRTALKPGGQALLSPSGRYTVSRGTSSANLGPRATRVYSTTDGRPLGPEIPTSGLLIEAAFSPNEQELALLSGTANVLRFVNWRTGNSRGEPIHMSSQPRSMRYGPNGDIVAVLCAGGEILIVNTNDTSVRSTWSNQVAYHHNNSYVDNGAIRFSPDGDAVITFQTDPAVRIWDWRTGKLKLKLEGHSERCSGVSFSPDGRLIATGSRDNTVRVWDYSGGRPESEVMRHPDWVYTVEFNPQGNLLITSCRDSQVRVWNWRSGKLHCPPFQHGHEVHTAAFTPDGRYAVTASEDRTARVWELVTGKPLTPPIPLGVGALNLQISPDGRRVVIGGFPEGSTHVVSLDALYDVDPIDAPDRRLLAELTASRKVDSTGGLAILTTEEWIATWRTLGPRRPSFASDLARTRANVFTADPIMTIKSERPGEKSLSTGR
jgi:WD40 repeat protein/tRNA A-37 threonylcarbamoyl transferase component Bud32